MQGTDQAGLSAMQNTGGDARLAWLCVVQGELLQVVVGG